MAIVTRSVPKTILGYLLYALASIAAGILLALLAFDTQYQEQLVGWLIALLGAGPD
jgi:hypothetical protein